MPITAQTLHEALLASDSATAVLEGLCRGPVTIQRLQASASSHPQRLPPGPGTVHRHVALLCAGQPLSEANLWYRPGLLPPAMVAELADTDAPFGRVVRALGLRRHTLSARICAPGEPFALMHHAVLRDANERDVAEVAERYRWALLEAV